MLIKNQINKREIKNKRNTFSYMVEGHYVRKSGLLSKPNLMMNNK